MQGWFRLRLSCPLWVISRHVQCTNHVRFTPESAQNSGRTAAPNRLSGTRPTHSFHKLMLCESRFESLLHAAGRITYFRSCS
jgi:hypothetical protein